MGGQGAAGMGGLQRRLMECGETGKSGDEDWTGAASARKYMEGMAETRNRK